MDFRQLQYFVEVCRTGNFTRAAQSLYISQQGLSSAVLRLERELGTPLFRRNARGVTLTPDGEYFLTEAEQLLHRYARINAYFSERSPRAEELRVCASFGVMMRLSQWLPGAFAGAAPDIRLHISEQPDALCEQAVSEGRCELGFTSGAVDERRFESCPMFTAPICVILRREHPLAGEKTIAFSALRGEPVYIMGPQFHTHEKFLLRCRAAGFEPSIGYETNEMGVVFSAVRKGLGVGIVNRCTALELCTPDIVPVETEDPTFVWDVSMIWRKGQTLSPAGERLLAFLQKALREEET